MSGMSCLLRREKSFAAPCPTSLPPARRAPLFPLARRLACALAGHQVGVPASTAKKEVFWLDFTNRTDKLSQLSLSELARDGVMVDRTPTQRELQILEILWKRGEASVRSVYEQLSKELPIVQNTVQALLRTMEEKGLVRHRVQGRTFIYKPLVERDETRHRLVSRLLGRVFDGAVDELVQSALSVRPPTDEELAKLEALIARAKAARKEPLEQQEGEL
jgi:BlaI family penicillinase repressor